MPADPAWAANGAAPAARQIGEHVSAAGDALQAKTGQLRDARDEWVESVRTTVRGSPLVTIAAALALGALIARITRRTTRTNMGIGQLCYALSAGFSCACTRPNY